MAKHVLILMVSCCVAVNAMVANAAPAERGGKSVSTPPMIKKIFVTNDALPKSDEKAPRDILKLGLPKRDATPSSTKTTSPVMAVATSAAALIFVIGIFLLIAWFMKRGVSRGMRTLPTEAFEVLGRSSLTAQQSVQLVRVGNKLLLVASSSDSATTLTEIDDSDEVHRLSGLCMTEKDTSATQEFSEAFEELAAASTSRDVSEVGRPSTMLDLSTPRRDSLSLSDPSLLTPNS